MRGDMKSESEGGEVASLQTVINEPCSQASLPTTARTVALFAQAV